MIDDHVLAIRLDPESKMVISRPQLQRLGYDNPQHHGHRVRVMGVADSCVVQVFCSCGARLTKPLLVYHHEPEVDKPVD